MKKIVFSLVMTFALATSFSAMAQDNTKKVNSTKTKTECCKKENKACCKKEAKDGEKASCCKKAADKPVEKK